MVRPVDRSQSPSPHEPSAAPQDPMRLTARRIQMLSLEFGAGHPPEFDQNAYGRRLDEYFHRKIG